MSTTTQPDPVRALHDALPPDHHDRHDLDGDGEFFAAWAAEHPEWCGPVATTAAGGAR